MRRRLGLPLGLCALLAAVIGGGAAAPAAAAPEQLTILDASNEAKGYYGEAARRDVVAEADDLGADVLRVILYWRDIAPAPGAVRPPARFNPRDPSAYDRRLRSIDRTVREADRHGIDVLLVPTGRFPRGGIPRWARVRPRSESNAPRASAFGALIQALGSRYRGGFDPDGGRGPERPLPRVRYISLWNEPNSGAFLQPRERAPEIYRRLVKAGARGAKRARWRGTLLGGETSAGGPNQMAPAEFLRRVACCGKLPVDGWSHHPYAMGFKPWEPHPDPGNVPIGALGRLTGPLSQAIAAGSLRRGTRLWLTEYGYESVPDPKGVPLAAQAEYNAISERIAYGNPVVASFPQYLLHDDPEIGGTYKAFETGLRSHRSGLGDCDRNPPSCKPAWFSFRTPLAARLAGEQALIWGRIRPARGPVTATVSYLDPGGAEGTAGVLRTDARGYFTFTAPAAEGRTWSVRSGRFQGPWIRGYAY